MSKRKRGGHRPLDFPLKGVLPLVPYLRAENIQTFAAPCERYRDLSGQLETSFGLRCLYSGDLEAARLLSRKDCCGAQAIITCPPRVRGPMHELIERFVATGLPTWLLIDLEWVSNCIAAPYLPRCSDIVVIGRVRWTDAAKYGWYRFSSDHTGATSIHNHRRRRRPKAADETYRATQHDGERA